MSRVQSFYTTRMVPLVNGQEGLARADTKTIQCDRVWSDGHRRLDSWGGGRGVWMVRLRYEKVEMELELELELELKLKLELKLERRGESTVEEAEQTIDLLAGWRSTNQLCCPT